MNKKHKAETAPAQAGDNHYPNCPDCGNNKHVKPYYGGGFRCTLCNRDFERVAPAPRGQHTNGPWYAADCIYRLDREGRDFIGIGNGAVHIGYASITEAVPLAEAKANAALIAQAPQLLTDNQALKSQVQKLREALQSMLEVSSCRSLSNVGGRGSVQSPAMRPAYGNHTATACDCCSCEAAIQARTALANPKEAA